MSLWKKIGLPLAFAAGLLSYTGCSDDASNNNNNENNPVAAFDVNSVSPSDGDHINGPVDFHFVVPEVDPDYQGSVDGSVTVTGDNGTPDDPSDDTTKEVFNDSVVSGQGVTVNVDPETVLDRPAKDGETFTLDAIVSASDAPAPNSQELTINLTYDKPAQKSIRVKRCDVDGSFVGAALGITCYCESDNGPVTGWNLDSDLDNAIITASGAITRSELTQSDVGLHTYNVTCSNDSETSDVYSFTVPVDEHKSFVNLHCGDGTENALYLPETTVDAVASACGQGFDPNNKPNTSSDPNYILDVDPSCIPSVDANLNPDERKAQENYNNGTTINDVYNSCTVDFAQVRYAK